MIVQFYWQPGPVLCVCIVRAIRSSKQIEARVQTSCLQLGAVGTEDFRKVLKAATPEAPDFESSIFVLRRLCSTCAGIALFVGAHLCTSFAQGICVMSES